MERPTDVTGVQRIMGTVGYLAKFLPRLSEVSQPLRQLTQKGTEFLWDEIHDRAFNRIKEMVTTPPLLKYYEREKDLVILSVTQAKGAWELHYFKMESRWHTQAEH